MTDKRQTGLKRICRTFLAIERVNELFAAYRTAQSRILSPSVGLVAAIGAVMVGAAPTLLIYFSTIYPSDEIPFVLIVVGTAAVLAIFIRACLGINFVRVQNWSLSLRRMHTSFGIGCLPAVIILIFEPKLLTSNRALLHSLSSQTSTGSQLSTLLMTLLWASAIALWAAITEEFIYRGMVVSVLRRWRVFKSQQFRDFIAVLVSSALFGLAHLTTWGPAAAVAMFGLGIGFSAAYIANGEELAPCIVYHFGFDFISVIVSLFLLR